MSLATWVTIGYGAASISQVLRNIGKLPTSFQLDKFFGVCCLILHSFLLYGWIELQQGQNLNPWLMLSLCTWLMGLIVFFSFNELLMKLSWWIYALAALALILYVNLGLNPMVYHYRDVGTLLHIGGSLIAFSLLFLALGQAILVIIQNKLLKNAWNHPYLKALPPLATMERVWFWLILSCFTFLTISLITGLKVIHSIQQTSLLSKSLLALLAWVMCAVILVAHQFYGLRGYRACRMTVLASFLLFASYFGTKTFFSS